MIQAYCHSLGILYSRAQKTSPSWVTFHKGPDCLSRIAVEDDCITVVLLANVALVCASSAAWYLFTTSVDIQTCILSRLRALLPSGYIGPFKVL